MLARVLAVATLTFASAALLGQSYPTKPIRIIVGGTGGGSDTTARIIGHALSATIGQPVLVENRPSGIIPGEVVSKSAPDGYTLLVTGSSLWIAGLLQPVPFDAIRDFAPVTLAASSPSVLTVHPSLPARTVKELIALARARPGELNYGTSGLGSAPHLSAELFKSMAHVDIVRVNYRGAGAALNDLLAGHVQMTFGTTSSVVPHLNSGRLRGLAVSSANPSALLPTLPTIAASGLPGYVSISPAALFAPAGTPRGIVDRLYKDIATGLNRADPKERLFNAGLEVVVSSPEELAAFVKAELTRWTPIIKAAGIESK